MNSLDEQYTNLLGYIHEKGKRHVNRTSQDTFRIWGHEIRHDMSEGFPLLTTKKMAYKAVFTEMLGFVRGETDIRWYQERGCKIWNADHERWHGPDLVRDLEREEQLGHEIQEKATVEGFKEFHLLTESIAHRVNDPHSLGLIYGAQWRSLNGYDQLKNIVEAAKSRSNSRRLIMSAWNPAQQHLMCLPPCHISYQFIVDGDELHASCWQRSCDTPLGVPFNIANLGLLCTLIANAAGLKTGEIVWYGNDVHIYENQLPGIEEQIHREPRALPILKIRDTLDPWDVEYDDLILTGYDPHPAIKYELTVS